jgi:hypothetical protein
VCSFRWVCQCSRLTLRCVDVFVCVYVCACTESELMYVCVCVLCTVSHTRYCRSSVYCRSFDHAVKCGVGIFVKCIEIERGRRVI